VTLFREGLDPAGRPVPVETFQGYMAQVLADIDRDFAAQEMIVEQWVAEAATARSFCTEAPASLLSVVDEFISEGYSTGPSWETDRLLPGDCFAQGSPCEAVLSAAAEIKDQDISDACSERGPWDAETLANAQASTLSTCCDTESPRFLAAIDEAISEASLTSSWDAEAFGLDEGSTLDTLNSTSLPHPTAAAQPPIIREGFSACCSRDVVVLTSGEMSGPASKVCCERTPLCPAAAVDEVIPAAYLEDASCEALPFVPTSETSLLAEPAIVGRWVRAL